MSFLLDTDILSQTRRPRLASRRFQDWLAAADADTFFISAVTLMEIEIGAVRASTKGLPHARLLREWIDDNIQPGFNTRILPVDKAVALRCAPIHVPKQRPVADALIAATALVHNLVVVTRNTSHFKPMGVRLLNPWDA